MSDLSQQFRDAMAHLCSAVSVVTSNGEAGTVGMTVSSVCSVSDSPATVLFCVNQSSELHDIIKQNGKVCINILNAEQQELAKHFAAMLDSTMDERFEWDIWDESEAQQILLRDAVANLEGEIIDSHIVGTHSIFIVRLSDIQVEPKAGLIYFARQFNVVEI
ncbi:4-hydroxyphenylacetate 3-monooxygenase, reductase component [Glaesserella sp.]|uniref:4-hydroxyphenylacetate 3-monooxygenase, reductase component n=1 Tax=Glaesserella sp. TaxID=2094731 RepID=UPI0035A03A08